MERKNKLASYKFIYKTKNINNLKFKEFILEDTSLINAMIKAEEIINNENEEYILMKVAYL